MYDSAQPAELCLGSSVGKSICLERRVSWVRIPPEEALFSLKMTTLGELCCVVLLCLSKSLRVKLSCTCMRDMCIVHVHALWASSRKKLYTLCVDFCSCLGTTCLFFMCNGTLCQG